MKVQIIQLEAEDDHASTRDRLSATRAEKAVLVWPRRGRPLSRRLDLSLVQRHARRLGIDLGLVTFDSGVIAVAKRIGLPVFESLDRLPGGSWHPDPSNQSRFVRRQAEDLERLRHSRAQIGPVTALELDRRGRMATAGLVGAALAAVALVVVPGARIGIEPRAAELTTTIELTLDPGLQAPTEGGQLPAVAVTTQVSGQMQMDTSGRIRAPEAAASGEVEFASLTGDPLTVPAGTGLRAGEVRFTTTRDLELEDSPASVPVVAAEPGRAGNVGAGEIDSVEGSLGFLVQVTNPEPISGGRDLLTGAVSEDDRQRLQTALMEQLLEQAKPALADELGEGRALAPGTLRITRVLEQEFDRQAGEVASSLSLRLSVEVEGLSFDRLQAERQIAAQLTESVPDGWFIVPGSLVFAPLDAEPDPARRTVEFRVKAAEARQLDLGAVRRAARGATAATIGEALQNRFRLASPARVELRPPWLPWVPLLEMRIGVDWVWSSG